MVTRINLKLPNGWNQCSTEQLELIANVMREQIERQDRYHPFSMQNVKVALFFAFSGIEILAGPNPRIPVEEQYYTCRTLSDRKRNPKRTFSLYLWQINYWLTPKPTNSDPQSPEYLVAGAGMLDWIGNQGENFLTRFPYPTIRRRKRLCNLLGKTFCGPLDDLNGFSWAQYRFASDTMSNYMQLSNSLVRMTQMKQFSEKQLIQQAQNVDLARAMFLATIFNGKTRFVDTTTGIVKYDYHYESNQCTDNAPFFRHFSETRWQVILFWWTGIMHLLSKRYSHVFKVQKTTRKTPTSPLEIYTATTATMQKYAGLTEDQVNHQSYSLVLEHLERLAVENEEIERMRSKS